MFVEEYPPFNAAIEEIMEFYDFERVHEVMTAVGWEWAQTNKDGQLIYGVPSVDKIKAEARRLLEGVVADIKDGQEHAYHSTGGLAAEYNSADQLALKFVVYDWEVDMPERYSKKFVKETV